MATGRLGAFDITATTNTTVYTCPASTFSVVTVSLCNRNASTARTVRIAIASSSTPTVAEYIEYDASLLANGVLERTGIVVDAGKLIVVYASAVDISCVVMGIETSTA
jgi:hypothetical protein